MGTKLEKMLETPGRSRVVWSGIAEPGDQRVGVLVRELGPQGALQWAMEPFKMPLSKGCPIADPKAQPESGLPTSEAGIHGLRRVWKNVHQRLGPRIQHFSVEKELFAMESLGGKVIFPDDPLWPARFADLEECAPFMLWVSGKMPELTQKSVAFVGARAASSYGKITANSLGYSCAKAGLTVISGGAYGIDAAAHKGAVSVERGTFCPTVAIMCGGLGNPYPMGNGFLFEEILERGGALVAEMPPSFRPARWRFLKRNRLIAAWADMVVVVEAGMRSGALATANRALDLGVSVGAVPGPVTSTMSLGPNSLLKDGAAVVTDVDDVLFNVRGDVRVSPRSEGNAQQSSERKTTLETLPKTQKRVWEALPVHGAVSLEKNASLAGLSKSETEVALKALQIKTLVTKSEDGWSRGNY